MKQHWLGDNYMVGGHDGNNITKTNIPDIRASYRYETLVDELHILSLAAKDALNTNSGTKSKRWCHNAFEIVDHVITSEARDFSIYEVF